MIANANLFVLNWDVTAYYEDTSAKNDDEYLMYLEHQVLLMEFIEAHLDELSASPRRRAPATTRKRV